MKNDVFRLLALICILCPFFLGCGTTLSTSVSPDRLQVDRSSAFPQNHIPPRTWSVTDAIAIQKLMATIQHLPPFPNNVIFCPVDWGVQYHLAFQYRSSPVLQATIDSGGCRPLRLSNKDVRETDDAFWALFAKTLGVPLAEMFPRPSP